MARKVFIPLEEEQDVSIIVLALEKAMDYECMNAKYDFLRGMKEEYPNAKDRAEKAINSIRFYEKTYSRYAHLACVEEAKHHSGIYRRCWAELRKQSEEIFKSLAERAINEIMANMPPE